MTVLSIHAQLADNAFKPNPDDVSDPGRELDQRTATHGRLASSNARSAVRGTRAHRRQRAGSIPSGRFVWARQRWLDRRLRMTQARM